VNDQLHTLTQPQQRTPLHSPNNGYRDGSRNVGNSYQLTRLKARESFIKGHFAPSEVGRRVLIWLLKAL